MIILWKKQDIKGGGILRNRQDDIRAKGFDLTSGMRRDYNGPLEYGSIKAGTKMLEDAVLNLGSIKKVNRQYGDKRIVL